MNRVESNPGWWWDDPDFDLESTYVPRSAGEAGPVDDVPVPICSVCKFACAEEFLEHGLCPRCAARMLEEWGEEGGAA